MPNPVRILKRKLDGSVRREFVADLVDERDDWLIAWHDGFRHERVRRGNLEPPGAEPYLVFFLGQETPLVVVHHFDVRGRLRAVQADAALPARLIGREISFVDLDLDLVVLPGGHWYARDFAALARTIASLHPPAETVALAREALRRARELAAGRTCPFDPLASEQVVGRELAAAGPL